MPSLAEVLSTKFNLCLVLCLVKIFAYFHDRVKDSSLAIDLNSILVSTSLLIEFSSFLPLTGIFHVICLFLHNDWVTLASWDLLHQLICLTELLKCSVHINCLLLHIVLDIVLGTFLIFALVG